MHKSLAILGLFSCAGIAASQAESLSDRIPIATRGASTYYIESHIDGYGPASLLVDTGSGYTAINEETLAVLNTNGNATYIKRLRGIMADGTKKVVPIYRIDGIQLGGKCYLADVEVAVFPKGTRPILGLNALRKMSPFIFSLEDPPSLRLSNCQPNPDLIPVASGGNNVTLSQSDNVAADQVVSRP